MLLLSRSAISRGAELSKCGSGWLATCSCCVCREWEWEGSWQWMWKWTVCTQMRYHQEQNTASIMLIVLSENDNSSQLFISSVLLNISFQHKQHYSKNWPDECQGCANRYTGTLHVVHIRLSAPSHLYTRLHLVGTYFIYCDNWLLLLNLVYFLSHYNCYWRNDK